MRGLFVTLLNVVLLVIVLPVAAGLTLAALVIPFAVGVVLAIVLVPFRVKAEFRVSDFGR